MLDPSIYAAVGADGARYAINKVARAQLGTGLHQVWMNDIIKHCGAKALLVCDFAHGVGEIMTAAVNSKVAEAATTTGVRVCTWGQDPRNIFADMGQAVGRTELSKLYVSGKLVVPGHQPVPDPGSRPERTRKLIKALMQKPLTNLSLDSEGHLIIPTQEEIAKAGPVTLSDEQERDFASWRVEFPRPASRPAAAVAAAAVGATEEGGISVGAGSSGAGNAQGSAGGGGSATPPPLAPGAQADSEATLKENIGDAILSQKPLPEGGAAATRQMTLCLTATQAADGAEKTWRVWLHNKASKNANVPASTLIGQGGPGKFVSLVVQNIEEHKMTFLGGTRASLGLRKTPQSSPTDSSASTKTALLRLSRNVSCCLMWKRNSAIISHCTFMQLPEGKQCHDCTKPDTGRVVASCASRWRRGQCWCCTFRGCHSRAVSPFA